jgi:hypothetical protein
LRDRRVVFKLRGSGIDGGGVVFIYCPEQQHALACYTPPEESIDHGMYLMQERKELTLKLWEEEKFSEENWRERFRAEM